jgi:hypothetical protein
VQARFPSGEREVTTSGTVSTTVFNTGKLIDRAFGRCQLAPQKITPEYIAIAQDLLYLSLSTIASKGIALWAQQKVILPLYDATQDVLAPLGTVDVLNANLRSITQIQLPAPGIVYTSSAGGIAANAFDNNLSTACTQTAPNGFLQVQYPAVGQPVVFGILPNATASWNITIQTSNDGVTWTTVYSNTALSAVAGAWFWQDVEGIPEAGVLYVRLQASGGTTLNVTEFVTGAAPQEIPIAKINRDDYSNLPNKWFTGRPLQFWYNKTQPQPTLTLWPAPALQFTFSQIVLYTQRYLQDVGTLTQTVEVPQRWFLPIMTRLAKELMLMIPEAGKGMGDTDKQILIAEDTNRWNEGWASESDGSPVMMRPMIRAYTR